MGAKLQNNVHLYGSYTAIDVDRKKRKKQKMSVVDGIEL